MKTITHYIRKSNPNDPLTWPNIPMASQISLRLTDKQKLRLAERNMEENRKIIKKILLLQKIV
jgi:hypothetical protein